MASPSASPQGHGPATKSPAPSQRSSPHQPLPPASSQSQGGVAPSHSTAEAPAQSAVQQGGDESDQQLSPGGTAPTAHAQPAAQHAQHAGQGSFKHAGHPRRQGQQHMGHSYQHHALVSSLLTVCHACYRLQQCLRVHVHMCLYMQM